ncbi:MAG TPA: hypothetical protein VFP39_06685, partial [Gemmatimonadales bacterium]|nr:hypothetical protein [Gemmatimonadales bacterium]
MAFALACRDTTAVTPPPSLTAVALSADSIDALAAMVDLQARGADSARVTCQADSGPVVATPAYPLDGGAARIAALGLLPETDYGCAVALLGPGGSTTSSSLSF